MVEWLCDSFTCMIRRIQHFLNFFFILITKYIVLYYTILVAHRRIYNLASYYLKGQAGLLRLLCFFCLSFEQLGEEPFPSCNDVPCFTWRKSLLPWDGIPWNLRWPCHLSFKASSGPFNKPERVVPFRSSGAKCVCCRRESRWKRREPAYTKPPSLLEKKNSSRSWIHVWACLKRDVNLNQSLSRLYASFKRSEDRWTNILPFCCGQNLTK